MNMNKVVELQRSFDEKHGWTLKDASLDSLLMFLNRDLIGLFGEIGELANIVKKINLENDARIPEVQARFNDRYKDSMKEEVIDSFVYILRIASHLNIDIEKEYLSKLNINIERFKEFEK